MQNLPLVVQLFYVKLGANIQKVLSSILTIKMLKRNEKRKVTLRTHFQKQALYMFISIELIRNMNKLPSKELL